MPAQHHRRRQVHPRHGGAGHDDRAYGDYDAFVVQLDSSLNASWQLALGSSANDAASIPAHGGKDLWLSRVAP